MNLHFPSAFLWQEKIGGEVIKCEEEVERFRITYDTIVSEDKVSLIRNKMNLHSTTCVDTMCYIFLKGS